MTHLKNTCDDCQPLQRLTDLFEVVKGGEDDVMTSSHQTHGRQQLQHQSFSPEKTIDVYALCNAQQLL